MKKKRTQHPDPEFPTSTSLFVASLGTVRAVLSVACAYFSGSAGFKARAGTAGLYSFAFPPSIYTLFHHACMFCLHLHLKYASLHPSLGSLGAIVSNVRPVQARSPVFSRALILRKVPSK